MYRFGEQGVYVFDELIFEHIFSWNVDWLNFYVLKFYNVKFSIKK